MASLTADQRRLPKLGAELYDAPDSSQFLFFTVTWEGTPNGSVVVGNYAVDPYTGDVWSAVIGCHEEKNKRLKGAPSSSTRTLGPSVRQSESSATENRSVRFCEACRPFSARNLSLLLRRWWSWGLGKFRIINRNIQLHLLNLNHGSSTRLGNRPLEWRLHAALIAIVGVINLRGI